MSEFHQGRLVSLGGDFDGEANLNVALLQSMSVVIKVSYATPGLEILIKFLADKAVSNLEFQSGHLLLSKCHLGGLSNGGASLIPTDTLNG